MALRVKATATGFRDGSLVHPGAEFSLSDGEKVPSWVEVLGSVEEPPKRKSASRAEPEPEQVEPGQQEVI